jgi:hypothetical protein
MRDFRQQQRGQVLLQERASHWNSGEVGRTTVPGANLVVE